RPADHGPEFRAGVLRRAFHQGHGHRAERGGAHESVPAGVGLGETAIRSGAGAGFRAQRHARADAGAGGDFKRAEVIEPEQGPSEPRTQRVFERSKRRWTWWRVNAAYSARKASLRARLRLTLGITPFAQTISPPRAIAPAASETPRSPGTAPRRTWPGRVR